MQQIKDFVGFELIQTFRAHRQWADAELSKLGLRAGQEMILLQLWQEEGLTQAYLAAQLAVEQPTMSIMLKRMEAAGLILRQADSADARVSRIYLTEKGRSLEEPVLKLWRELENKSVAGLNLAEQLLLRRLLIQMRANFKP